MKDRNLKWMAVLTASYLMLLSACGTGGNAPAAASADTSARITSDESKPETSGQIADAAPAEETTKQAAPTVDKSGWPVMTVNVTGSKTADITVRSNGRVYYGLSISLVDPTLEGYDKGTFFSLSLTYFQESNDRWCWLKHPYPTYPADEPDIEVPYENISGNDYVFHVTLPASTSVTFGTITEYDLWLQEDAADTSFNSVGPYSAGEVVAEGADHSETPDSDMPMSVGYQERFESAVEAVAGNYIDAENRSLNIGGVYGSYVFWPSGFGLYDKIEVSSWAENEYYDIHKNIDADGRVTIKCDCIKGDNAGKSITFVINGNTVEVTCGDVTAVFDESNKH